MYLLFCINILLYNILYTNEKIVQLVAKAILIFLFSFSFYLLNKITKTEIKRKYFKRLIKTIVVFQLS